MQNIIEVTRSENEINWRDLTIIAGFHLLSIPALFMFNWRCVTAMIVGNWLVGGLGVGLGFHRLLTHRSFRSPKWLEYFLTTLGTMSLQNEPYKWVATHRLHHQFVETEKDPHSTRPGFWWAHVIWIMRGSAQDHSAATYRKYVPDLLKDKFHAVLAKYYYVPLVLSAFALYAVGGWAMVFWGVFVRVVVGWHTIWFVNSLSHMFGRRRFETDDDSTNNWFVAILTFGEGWHNNHHAHPTSARHGLAWYEFDLNWLTIRFFKRIGLAKNIRVYETDKVSVER